MLGKGRASVLSGAGAAEHPLLSLAVEVVQEGLGKWVAGKSCAASTSKVLGARMYEHSFNYSWAVGLEAQEGQLCLGFPVARAPRAAFFER